MKEGKKYVYKGKDKKKEEKGRKRKKEEETKRKEESAGSADMFLFSSAHRTHR